MFNFGKKDSSLFLVDKGESGEDKLYMTFGISLVNG